MPKVSVLMPVYNTKEEYLRESIESILNQTYKDFEFIIINDGSINNAEEVILSYKDERIIYIKNKQNLGTSCSLNKGIEVIRGKYMIRMDSDDISLPERIEKQIEFMDKNLQVDISGTWFLRFPQKRSIKLPTKNEEIKNFLLLSHNPIGGATTIFRRSSIDKFNIKYNENDILAEDLGLWLKLIDKVNFANLPEFLYKYRFHSESASVKSFEVLQKSTMRLITEARNKICEIDTAHEVEIMDKLIEKEVLTSEEVLTLFNNINLIFAKLKVKFPSFKYSRKSAAIIKNAIKLCKKDKKFIKILFKGSIYKLLTFGLILKIFNT